MLIYLEADALGRAKPAFAAHLTPALLAAAESLGLRALEVRCRLPLGSTILGYRLMGVQQTVTALCAWCLARRSKTIVASL